VGDEFVQLVGPDSKTDKPTRIVLSAGLKDILGHDVMLQGYRRKDAVGDDSIIVAEILIELSDEPDTVPEKQK
jgi:hypothetical protein